MDSHSIHLLEQYSQLEYLLLGDLRDLLEERPDAENRRWLLAVLEVLIDMLPREFALACEDGYLQFVCDRQPSWERQVNRLQCGHDRIYDRLRLLRDRIADDASIGPLSAQLRRDLGEWMESLVDHHREEKRLLQTAANLDTGSGE